MLLHAPPVLLIRVGCTLTYSLPCYLCTDLGHGDVGVCQAAGDIRRQCLLHRHHVTSRALWHLRELHTRMYLYHAFGSETRVCLASFSRRSSVSLAHVTLTYGHATFKLSVFAWRCKTYGRKSLNLFVLACRYGIYSV